MRDSAAYLEWQGSKTFAQPKGICLLVSIPEVIVFFRRSGGVLQCNMLFVCNGACAGLSLARTKARIAGAHVSDMISYLLEYIAACADSRGSTP